MDQSIKIPIYKSKQKRPLFYTHLVTSNPDSYQISKRIKRIFGYSEHFKDYHQKHPFTKRDFYLKGRDYRKARELTLEIWHPVRTSKYWLKFLKSIKNIQKIKIKVLEIEIENEGGSIYYGGVARQDILKEVCRGLGKVHWLQRIQIDFGKGEQNQARSLLKKTRCLRTLPRLKDLAITIEGEEIFPFSVSLLKVGFDVEFGIFSTLYFKTDHSKILVKETSIIEKLLKRAPPKFKQLDTIKINSKDYGFLPAALFNGLAFVIPKLPNFREFNLNFLKDVKLPIKQTFNVLDVLLKASKLEIMKVGLQIQEISQLSILNHPVFKAPSLKKTHLSLFLGEDLTSENLDQTLNFLREIPSLYELSLDFSNEISEMTENLMKKVSAMRGIRRLKIVFGNRKINFAGNIVREIFNNMPFLEELDLRLPNNSLDFAGEKDIQGLPRLTKAYIKVKQCEARMEKSICGVMEILGKCWRLRELEIDITDSVHDFSGTMRRLLENLVKLKRLQVFKLKTNLTILMPGQSQIDFLKDFVTAFDKMRSLQDFHLETKPTLNFSRFAFGPIQAEVERKKKYRFYNLGWKEDQRYYSQ